MSRVEIILEISDIHMIMLEFIPINGNVDVFLELLAGLRGEQALELQKWLANLHTNLLTHSF